MHDHKAEMAARKLRRAQLVSSVPAPAPLDPRREAATRRAMILCSTAWGSGTTSTPTRPARLSPGQGGVETPCPPVGGPRHPQPARSCRVGQLLPGVGPLGRSGREAEGDPDPAQTPAGYVQPSPWLAIANRQLELMHKFMGELGSAPASRSRVAAFPSLAPKPWEFDSDLEFGVDDGPVPAAASTRTPAAAVTSARGRRRWPPGPPSGSLPLHPAGRQSASSWSRSVVVFQAGFRDGRSCSTARRSSTRPRPRSRGGALAS